MFICETKKKRYKLHNSSVKFNNIENGYLLEQEVPNHLC